MRARACACVRVGMSMCVRASVSVSVCIYLYSGKVASRFITKVNDPQSVFLHNQFSMISDVLFPVCPTKEAGLACDCMVSQHYRLLISLKAV